MTDQEQSVREPARGRGFIYFVRADHFLKIGWSQNPRSRVSDLQVACPHELELIGTYPGTQEDEMALHILLKQHHARGEWFHANDDVLRIVKAKLGHGHAMYGLAAKEVIAEAIEAECGIINLDAYNRLPDYWVVDQAA